MTPTPTPPPQLIKVEDELSASVSRFQYRCPYEREVHTVKRLVELGVEESAVLNKRRSLTYQWVGGALIAAILALASWLYIQNGTAQASDARRDARIERVEEELASRAGSDAALEELRLELARVTERLSNMDRRLQNIEVSLSGQASQSGTRRDRTR